MMGLCQCGCGEPTRPAPQTDKRRGWVKGEPIPFVNAGHARRLRKRWEERDCGHSTPCWVWLGAISTGGYARVRVDHKPARLAHRVIFEERRGPIPESLTLDHLCRNRACVNPEHLEPVTLAENIRRGTSANGLKTHCPHGHPYDADNTIYRATGARVCRQCNIERNRAWYARVKTRNLSALKVEAEALR